MNIEQMKQIVKGAPEGATHAEIAQYSDNHHYWDLVNFRYYFRTSGWERQYAGIHPDKGFTSLSDLRTIIAQAEEIERLKSKFPQWVSVNERLPDVFTGYSQDVLVLRGNTVSPKIQIGYLRAAKELQWFGYYDEEYRFNDVTHWIPLPTPPKGEGE